MTGLPRNSSLFAIAIAITSIGFAASAEAVTFRIVDAVVSPGVGTAELHLVIDPQGSCLDGIQFGVEVEAGAIVSGVSLIDEFIDVAAAAGGLPVPTVTSLPEGSGFTFVLDLDDDDLVRFDGSTAFPAAEIEITFAVPPTAGQTFDVSLTSSLGTPAVPIGYTTGGVLHTAVTAVTGSVRVGDQQRDFDTAGPADVSSAGNWAPNGVPQAIDDLFVRNDGTAEGNGGELVARSLRVGDTTGDGTVTTMGSGIRIADDLEVGGHKDVPFAGLRDIEGSMSLSDGVGIEAAEMSVARLPVSADADVTAIGSLSIQDVDRVTALNNIFVGEINDDSGSFVGVTANATGTLHIDEVSSLSIGTDLAISSIFGDGNETTAGLATTSTVTLENIGEVLIGDDLRGADRLCDETSQAGSRQLEVNLTVANVGQFRTGSDIRLTDGESCRGAEMHTAMATASFSDIGQLIVGDDIEFPSFGWQNASAVSDLDGTLELTRVDRFFVQRDVEVGISRADELTTGTLTADHTLTLTDVPTLEIGRRLRIGGMSLSAQPGVTATATTRATVSISESSVTVSDYLLVGAVFQGDLDMSSGVPDAMSGLDVSGSLTLSRSSLQVPLVWVGVVEQGLFANPSGSVTLSGFLGTSLLEVGENGTLVLQIEGDEPASSLTVGQARSARISVGDAALEGVVQVEFLYTPLAAVQTYDLIVAPLGALADTTGSLELLDIPTGYSQRSFGVVSEGGFDILRLEIVQPSVFSDGFESSDTTAWSATSP
ncbi:MAG: hypothetical protein MPN21_16980 [Thermoanaerobaculia bacterium]|nr:hypothetical protein [Thermoanaerobaculia bacterium]